jgi:hypothetical protein
MASPCRQPSYISWLTSSYNDRRGKDHDIATISPVFHCQIIDILVFLQVRCILSSSGNTVNGNAKIAGPVTTDQGTAEIKI